MGYLHKVSHIIKVCTQNQSSWLVKYVYKDFGISPTDTFYRNWEYASVEDRTWLIFGKTAGHSILHHFCTVQNVSLMHMAEDPSRNLFRKRHY